MKRTFQIALYGASDAANRKVLASLHTARAKAAKLVHAPDVRGMRVEFFDYEHVTAALRATFRLHGGKHSEPNASKAGRQHR